MEGHDAEEMETGMENSQKETSSDSSDTEMASKNDDEEADDKEWGLYTENSCLLDIGNIINIWRKRVLQELHYKLDNS